MRSVNRAVHLLAFVVAWACFPAAAQQSAPEQMLDERFDRRALHDAMPASGALPLPEREAQAFAARSAEGG